MAYITLPSSNTKKREDS